MKLPDDPKERTKIFVLIGIGVVVVLILVYYFGIRTLLESRAKSKAEIAKLKDDCEQAEKEIDQMAGDRKSNSETVLRIKDTSDKYVLKPGLDGRYLLGAAAIIERHAVKLGITMATPPADAGVVDLPLARGAAKKTMKAFGVRANLKCGYADVVRLVRAVESENPMISVSLVNITGQRDDSKKHVVGVEFQWPIWVDQDMPSKLEAKLKEKDEEPKAGAKK